MDDVRTRLKKAAMLAGKRTRKELAEFLGWNPARMDGWVARQRIPSAGAKEIVQTLGVPDLTIDYLLTGRRAPKVAGREPDRVLSSSEKRIVRKDATARAMRQALCGIVEEMEENEVRLLLSAALKIQGHGWEE